MYYGVTLGTGDLGGSPYINFMIAGAVEIPAFFICILLLNKVGRRKLLTGMMVLSGLSSIAAGFVSKSSGVFDCIRIFEICSCHYDYHSDV